MRSLSLIVLPLIAVCILAAPPRPALAQQSQRELREQNDSLRAEVEDLQRELEAAREEIQRLQALVTSLEKQLVAAGADQDEEDASTDGDGQKPTVTETDPHDSPRALLREAAKRYQEALDGMDRGEMDDSPERRSYLRAVNQWTARFNREMRKPIQWPVRIVREPRPAERGVIVRMEMVDPKTGAAIGDAFDAFIPRAVVDRLAELEPRMDLMEQTFSLRGTLVPNVGVNPQRSTKGAFNNPPLIGPYAEFGFAVETRTLTLWEDRAPADESDEGEGEAGASV